MPRRANAARHLTSTLDAETRIAVHQAIDAAAPDQQLTVLVLLQHPALLRAVDMFLDELSNGLR